MYRWKRRSARGKERETEKKKRSIWSFDSCYDEKIEHKITDLTRQRGWPRSSLIQSNNPSVKIWISQRALIQVKSINWIGDERQVNRVQPWISLENSIDIRHLFSSKQRFIKAWSSDGRWNSANIKMSGLHVWIRMFTQSTEWFAWLNTEGHVAKEEEEEQQQRREAEHEWGGWHRM